jgi:hypothetical protein
MTGEGDEFEDSFLPSFVKQICYMATVAEKIEQLQERLLKLGDCL